MQQPAVARAVGSRVLDEIEETSLDEILSSLRVTVARLEQQQQQQQQQQHSAGAGIASTLGAPVGGSIAAVPNPAAGGASRPHHATRPLQTFPFAPLNAIVARHLGATRPSASAPPLAVSGRYLPLLYALIATLVAPPLRKAVVVVDLDGRFDATRLLDCVPFPGKPGDGMGEGEEQRASHVDRATIHTAVAGIEGFDTRVPARERSTATAATAATAAAVAAAATATGTSGMPPPPLPPQPRRCPVLQPADLEHVHVSAPPRGNDDRARAAEAIAAAEQHMLYGRHGSRGREWWGTVVLGGDIMSGGSASASLSRAAATATTAGTPSTTIAAASTTATAPNRTVGITAGWKGWLRVDREGVRGFAPGISIEEALAERGRRQAAVEASGWVAGSGWGGFVFGREGSA